MHSLQGENRWAEEGRDRQVQQEGPLFPAQPLPDSCTFPMGCLVRCPCGEEAQPWPVLGHLLLVPATLLRIREQFCPFLGHTPVKARSPTSAGCRPPPPRVPSSQGHLRSCPSSTLKPGLQRPPQREGKTPTSALWSQPFQPQSPFPVHLL
jgi:hypothetical protein